MNTASAPTPQPLIRLLADALPKRVVSIRTDYVVTPGGKNRRVLNIEAPGRSMPRIRLSDWESERQIAVKDLGNRLNLKAPEATSVVVAGAMLAEGNDLGAWILRPAQTPEQIICRRVFGPLGRLRQQPELADALDTLSRALPADWRVRLDYMPATEGMPNVHRRAWATFVDDRGCERAAISLGFTSIQLRQHIQSDAEYADAAQRRLGRWAHQLGIDRRDFIRAFLAIEMLSRYTEATEILIEA